MKKKFLSLSAWMINYWAWLSQLGFQECWVFDEFFSVVVEDTKVGSC